MLQGEFLRPVGFATPRNPSWHTETMKTFNLGPLLLAYGLMLGPGTMTAKEPSSNLELARQLNQAFVEVAEKVSPSVVVINVVQKPTASATSDDEEIPFHPIPREFPPFFPRQSEDTPPEKSQEKASGVI